MMATLNKYAGNDAFAKENPRTGDPDKFSIRPRRSTGLASAFGIAFALSVVVFASSSFAAESVDLSNAIIVVRAGERPAAEKVAPSILTEEMARRTGIHWSVASEWPDKASALISVSTVANPPAWQNRLGTLSAEVPEKPESFVVRVTPASAGHPATVNIVGRDARGAMFGIGSLLRNLAWSTGSVLIGSEFKATEAPDRPLRGHQIGYRDTANSWDAWTVDQFDQYFREMVIFGANAVENIPWQEDIPDPLMKYSRDEMNVRFAELCEKYDLQHWIWAPVLIDLPNESQETAFLEQQEAYYRKIKRLDAVFVPGGDPGANRASVLLPYLERMAALVIKYHPNCKVWLSLQHHLNKPEDIGLLYQYLETKQPTWFGGLVMGPGSPPMERTRKRLPPSYGLRWYPDITHVVRCQYPVPWMDPALGLTLGRECVNPRPADYTQIYRMDYGFTDGFLTYSDGVHDDFNKSLWSQLGWNPKKSPREIAIEYARFFFHPEIAVTAADGLFALETDLRGALADNGSIIGTYHLWKEFEHRIPDAGSRWRLRMHIFRAYYDQLARARLLYETELERQALEKLADARRVGVPASIDAARQLLQQAVTQSVDPGLRTRLFELGEELFREIGLQTSVPMYHASGYERGAVLDFIDTPLNNRWWLEDQLEKIGKITDPASQIKQIDVVRHWENPGEGGHYDAIGHVGRSPRIVKLLLAGDAMRHHDDLPTPTQRWMGEKRNGLRQAWNIYMDSIPGGITYNDLDTSGHYIVKLFSQRASPLVIDGVKAELIATGEKYDQVTEQVFDVPDAAIKDGRITLTWEALDEIHLNWRQRHYVTDIWVMKRPAK